MTALYVFVKTTTFVKRTSNSPLHAHFTYSNGEIASRQKLEGAGLKNSGRLQKQDKDKRDGGGRKKRSSAAAQSLAADDEQRCDVSKKICYMSMVGVVQVKAGI